MYRCSGCREVSKPRQPMKKHITYKKEGKQIESEIPVCGLCLEMLQKGVSIVQIQRMNTRKALIAKAMVEKMQREAASAPKPKRVD